METVNEIEDSPYSTTNNVHVDDDHQEQLRLKIQLQETNDNDNTIDNESATAVATATAQSQSSTPALPRSIRRLHSASLTTTPSASGITTACTGTGQPGRVVSAGNRGVPERARSANYGPRNRVVMRSKSNCGTNGTSNGGGVATRVGTGPGAGTAMSRRAPPPGGRGVAVSYSGGLRALAAGQIVNTPIERKMSNRMHGPGGTIQRTVSDISSSGGSSYDDTTTYTGGGGVDISLHTMDSINVRKHQQLVAEPLDDKSYLYTGTNDDDCSFADHESFVTRMTGDDFSCVSGMQQHRVPMLRSNSSNYKNIRVPDSTTTIAASLKQSTERLQRIGITESFNTSTDDQSMESGLTNDLDFGFDDYDDDDEYDENDFDEFNEEEDDDEYNNVVDGGEFGNNYTTSTTDDDESDMYDSSQKKIPAAE